MIYSKSELPKKTLNAHTQLLVADLTFEPPLERRGRDQGPTVDCVFWAAVAAVVAVAV